LLGMGEGQQVIEPCQLGFVEGTGGVGGVHPAMVACSVRVPNRGAITGSRSA
jgi:hypothetical protein